MKLKESFVSCDAQSHISRGANENNLGNELNESIFKYNESSNYHQVGGGGQLQWQGSRVSSYGFGGGIQMKPRMTRLNSNMSKN